MAEDQSRRRRKWTILLLVLLPLLVAGATVAIVLVVMHSGHGHDDGGYAPYTLDVAYDRAPFVELIYEQDFGDLASAPPAADGPAQPRLGYVHRPEAAKLFRYRGTGELAAGRMLVGRKMAFLYSHDARWDHAAWSDLSAVGNGPFAWQIDAQPEPAVAVGDVFASIRVPAAVTVAPADNGAATVTVGEKATQLTPGERQVVWTGSRSFALADYLAEARRIDPHLPELDDAKLAQAKPFLGVGDDGKVTLFARLTAINHGPTDVAGVDLGWIADQARQAADRGEYDKADVLIATYRNIYPEDGAMRDLQATAARRRETRSERVRLAGAVRLPEPLAAEKGPAQVALRRASDPAGSFLAATVVTDGRYELFAPAGEYEVQLIAPGYKAMGRNVTLEGAKELDIELTPADKLQ
ncbi:MAG: hypothetical protein BIFFINMI_02965 [Phycisphaerae bacterium]|nr:hypothetical protein [Phycisphaerae bacterium]